MNIAFIGTGKVATTLGTRLAEQGHHVVLGSRTPDRSTERGLPVLAHEEAVTTADVVVIAVPGVVAVDAVADIGPELFARKVVIDVTNAIRAFTPPVIDAGYPDSSIAEQLQALLPAAHVVKTGNTTGIEVIADPSTLDDPGSVFLSGDDETAKHTVAALLHGLGWPEGSIIDLGDVITARLAEQLFRVVLAVTVAKGAPTNVAFTS